MPIAANIYKTGYAAFSDSYQQIINMEGRGSLGKDLGEIDRLRWLSRKTFRDLIRICNYFWSPESISFLPKKNTQYVAVPPRIREL